MCTSPISIYNNSKYVNLHSFDVKRTVPCGHCWQCQLAKQSEYAIRGFYEWQDSLNKGSYAYWDTLTYRESKLPRVCGVPCFNRRHLQLFMKKLRYRLKKHYNLPKDAFRYLAVGEYGGKKERPHYHVIFFCKFNREVCSPTEFHDLVKSIWYNDYGITDMVHGKNPESLVITSNAGLLYVTKYLYKDANRFAELREKVQNNVFQRFPDLVISNNAFRKRFQNFQLHSLGFGSYLLQVQDVSNMTCSMPVSYNTEKEYNLPLYYLRMRKNGKNVLPYMDLIKMDEDSYKWICTPLMVKYKLSKIHQNVKVGAIDLKNRILNLSKYVEKIKLNDYEIYKKIHIIADSLNLQINNLSDSLANLYDVDSLQSLYIYAVSKRFRLSDQPETLEDVIYNRCVDVGDILNPLRYDINFDANISRELYDFDCYIRGSTLYDFTLDILNIVAAVYGRLNLQSELNKIAINKSLNDG